MFHGCFRRRRPYFVIAYVKVIFSFPKYAGSDLIENSYFECLHKYITANKERPEEWCLLGS
jgi:hypothetical protein